MRLEIPKEVERFGAVRFGGLQRVIELDSGLKGGGSRKGSGIEHVPYELLDRVWREMAIVVPVKNERLKLIEGVLSAIPHSCLIIVVSNSPREPVDRFAMEADALRDHCVFTNQNALIVHQKDPHLARALKRVKYPHLLNARGEIRDGKAEGLLVGILLARLAGKRYVGFVDADNYIPGSVEEYVREYAAGLWMSRSRYAMVRIAWHSKPKIAESKLSFRKWGRASGLTNRMLNRLIGHYTGYETEIIKTGNAGEHAMAMDLALALDYSGGYSIEPYHIVNLMERFGGIVESPVPEAMKQKVEVYQIESRNPHLHEAGDEDHIREMSRAALSVIHHSPICPPALQEEILVEMRRRQMVSGRRAPPRPHRYPALGSIEPRSLLRALGSTPYARLIREGDL